jgi:primosomal replication protein N
MSAENQLNNSAALYGRVQIDPVFSHEIYGEGFYGLFVEVRRLSEASDVLPATVSERLIDREHLVSGAWVRVSGQLRSYNSFVEPEKRSRLILTVFAQEIEFVPPEDCLKQNPNEVFLNGFICKPPVYRTTPLGREIADIMVAVNRTYNKSDYIPCIAWGRNARFSGNLRVGDNITVSGRLQSRAYQKKLDDGQTVEKTAYEVSVSKIMYAQRSGEI